MGGSEMTRGVLPVLVLGLSLGCGSRHDHGAVDPDSEVRIALTFIVQVVEDYLRVHGGRRPQSLAELDIDVVRNREREDLGSVVDPWGNPYRFSIDERGKVDASSDGPDRLHGTDDDISFRSSALVR